MKHFARTSALVAALAGSLALVACDKPVPVNPPTPVIVTPGPAGPAGATGAQGNTGATGSTGSTGATGMPGAPASAASMPTN